MILSQCLRRLKGKSMSNEELKEKQKALIDEYQKKMDSEPEIKKWVEHKKRLRLFGIVFILAYYVIYYLAYKSINAEINVLLVAAKALFGIGWFSFFIAPTGAWKLNVMFYVSAIVNSCSLAKVYMKYGDFSAYFSNGPLLAICMVMCFMIPVLYCILACWLTVPEKNRKLSDRAQELYKEYIDNLNLLAKNK